MIICKNSTELRAIIHEHKNRNKSIGFVPTMGALHQGHISLVEKSVAENTITCASIFVNPIQFNNAQDLELYPRTIDADIEMLANAGCNIVYIPEVSDMYPEGLHVKESYNFGELELVMEGKFRPGHFNGVAVVVKRLFDLVPADKAYFGLKDFQQLAIIQSLVEQLQIPIHIVPCETVREADGLAMSSRNMRLNPEERMQATEISKTLFTAQALQRKKTIEEIKTFVIDTINTVPLLSVEYFEIVDEQSLQSIQEWPANHTVRACIAVHIGNIRLIDNISL